MKTTTILAALLGFLLMVNCNVALAQNENTQRQDSIYGLEVTLVRDNFIDLSFYSTYDWEKLWGVQVHFYSGNRRYNYYAYDYYHNNNAFFNDNPLIGEANIEYIDGNICKITIRNCLLIAEKEKDENVLIDKLEVFMNKSSWKSNVLTFFFDPLMQTSLKLIESSENYTYKYFLLSGIESQKKPIGIPFIQVSYKNGMPVATNKYLISQ
jgi:hypothetical protein